MATDFSYNDKTINSNGPIKPTGINRPLDPRTEVKLYADIENIPSPYVGMIITVLQDETNSGKMTDYKVLSLKADSYGIANSVIDQVQRYADYLGANGQGIDTNNFATKEELGLKADKTELHSHINKTVLDGITSTNIDNWNNKVDKVEGKTLTTNDYTNEEKQTVANLKATVGDTSSGLVKDVKDLKTNGVSQDNINVAIENYLQEHPVQSGATAEQAAQIEANRTAIGDENTGLIKGVNDLTESLSNVDAVSLNGKSFSEPMTKDEYDTIVDKNPNTIYLINDEQVINSVPDYSTSDANKILAVNASGTALAWINAPIGEGGSGLTDEQINKLNSIDSKVDKVDGKGLSTNDYTNEEKTTLANLKTTVGDNSLGLVKDVKDLKTNGVSQDNINSAVENYLQSHPVTISLVTYTDGDTFIIEENTESTEVFGNIIVSNNNITINENSTVTLDVNLDKAPTNNQTITINKENENIILGKNSLTFTAENYNIVQTITITGVHNETDYLDKTCKLTLTSNNVSNVYVDIIIKNIDENPSPDSSLILFLNGEGGNERFDDSLANGTSPAKWIDQTGNGHDIVFTCDTPSKSYPLIQGDNVSFNMPGYFAKFSTGKIENIDLSIDNFTIDMEVKPKDRGFIGINTNTINAPGSDQIALGFDINLNATARHNYDKPAIIENTVSDNNTWARLTLIKENNTLSFYKDKNLIGSESTGTYTLNSSSFIFLSQMNYKYIKLYSTNKNISEL